MTLEQSCDLVRISGITARRVDYERRPFAVCKFTPCMEEPIAYALLKRAE